MKYRLPRPCECFKCGEKCYAVTWIDRSIDRKDVHNKDKIKVWWRCARCSRVFSTLEHLESIMVEVDEKPQSGYAEYEIIEG